MARFCSAHPFERVLPLLLLLAIPLAPLRGQVAKLFPTDEAPKDASFFMFRSRLLQALSDRDEAFLLSVLSPDIKSSFGGDAGIADFRSFWELDQPGSAVWRTLLTTLSLGGSFDGSGYFVAPYTYSKFPGTLDAFEHGVILGDAVEARKQPAADSEVVAVLSSDVVRVSDWTPLSDSRDGREWIAIQLAGGVQAFVPPDQLRSPIDYRAIFERKDGKWLLTIFVAGD